VAGIGPRGAGRCESRPAPPSPAFAMTWTR
jgi:hypothetical protein